MVGHRINLQNAIRLAAAAGLDEAGWITEDDDAQWALSTFPSCHEDVGSLVSDAAVRNMLPSIALRMSKVNGALTLPGFGRGSPQLRSLSIFHLGWSSLHQRDVPLVEGLLSAAVGKDAGVGYASDPLAACFAFVHMRSPQKSEGLKVREVWLIAGRVGSCIVSLH